MTEKFEGDREISRSFSEVEMARIQELLNKVREVIEWDLGAFCSATEDLDIVNRSKDAINDLGVMFNRSKEFSSGEMQSLHTMLDKIDEVLGWDIGISDETDRTLLYQARESLDALKKLIK